MAVDRRFIWFLFPVKYELISEKAALNDSKEVGWLWQQQPGSGGRSSEAAAEVILLQLSGRGDGRQCHGL